MQPTVSGDQGKIAYSTWVGSASDPWFAALRELMLARFPRTTDVVVEGGDHGLPLTHAGEAAVALAEFLRAHSS